MKYLKSYNESNSDIERCIENVKDILLDINDFGYETKVRGFSNLKISRFTSHESDISGIFVEVLSRGNVPNRITFPYIGTKPKDISNTSECVETIFRVIDYMKQEGYKVSNIELTSYSRPGFPIEFKKLKSKIVNKEFVAYPLIKKRIIPSDKIALYGIYFIK